MKRLSLKSGRDTCIPYGSKYSWDCIFMNFVNTLHENFVRMLLANEFIQILQAAVEEFFTFTK